MDTNRRLVYSGERFRDFLVANHITYQEASNTLGIDKNTIGKAVRGGNLNTSILLKICNEYKLDLTDFFVEETEENNLHGKAGSIYSAEHGAVGRMEEEARSAAEEDEPYGTKEKTIIELLHSKDAEISRLRMLVKLYQERVDLLQQKLINGAGE